MPKPKQVRTELTDLEICIMESLKVDGPVRSAYHMVDRLNSDPAVPVYGTSGKPLPPVHALEVAQAMDRLVDRGWLDLTYDMGKAQNFIYLSPEGEEAQY